MMEEQILFNDITVLQICEEGGECMTVEIV